MVAVGKITASSGVCCMGLEGGKTPKIDRYNFFWTPQKGLDMPLFFLYSLCKLN